MRTGVYYFRSQLTVRVPDAINAVFKRRGFFAPVLLPKQGYQKSAGKRRFWVEEANRNLKGW